MNLPGPFSVRLRGLSLKQQIAADKETIRKARDGVRSLRWLFTRREAKKTRRMRRSLLNEIEAAVRQHHRDGTIT
jgi:hypothetical protein